MEITTLTHFERFLSSMITSFYCHFYQHRWDRSCTCNLISLKLKQRKRILILAVKFWVWSTPETKDRTKVDQTMNTRRNFISMRTGLSGWEDHTKSYQFRQDISAPFIVSMEPNNSCWNIADRQKSKMKKRLFLNYHYFLQPWNMTSKADRWTHNANLD